MDHYTFAEKLEEVGITPSEFEAALPEHLKDSLLPGAKFDQLKFTEVMRNIQEEYVHDEDDANPEDAKDVILAAVTRLGEATTANNWDVDYSDTLDQVLEEIVGISEDEFRDAVGEPGDKHISMYDENNQFDLSRVTELVAAVNAFKVVNVDWTKEDVLEFITSCVETAESVKHFYIYNNDRFIPVFHRLAIEREALYNPVIPIAVVDHICPSCNHDKAYHWTAQMRSSDEPLQINYKCIKCRYLVKS